MAGWRVPSFLVVGAIKGPAEQYRDDADSVWFGLVCDRADLAFGGGVVDRDIETAKPCEQVNDL